MERPQGLLRGARGEASAARQRGGRAGLGRVARAAEACAGPHNAGKLAARRGRALQAAGVGCGLRASMARAGSADNVGGRAGAAWGCGVGGMRGVSEGRGRWCGRRSYRRALPMASAAWHCGAQRVRQAGLGRVAEPAAVVPGVRRGSASCGEGEGGGRRLHACAAEASATSCSVRGGYAWGTRQGRVGRRWMSGDGGGRAGRGRREASAGGGGGQVRGGVAASGRAATPAERRSGSGAGGCIGHSR